MHSVLRALHEVIHPDRHLALRPDRCVVLREHDAAATLTHLNLDCRGCEHLAAFTLDARTNTGQPIALSEHTSKSVGSKWNKVCDGVFVWYDTGAARWRVLVCDLKSDTPSGGDWKEQLWSSACFVDYLFSILRRFYADMPRPESLQFHAVAFHGEPRTLGKGKRTTAIRLGLGYPRTSLENPGKMPVTNNQYVPLRALCA